MKERVATIVPEGLGDVQPYFPDMLRPGMVSPSDCEAR